MSTLPAARRPTRTSSSSYCVRTKLKLLVPLLALFATNSARALDPPLPGDLAEGAGIVKSRAWAVVLGKALFWDEQAGSDGIACASCHFHAGADARLKNQLNPGFKDLSHGPQGDPAFGSDRSDLQMVAPGSMPSGAIADSNYTLTPADFPLHQLVDEADRNSPVRTTTNDRVSSQGAFGANFVAALGFGLPELCGPADDGIFHAGFRAARQVEPRNTPSVVNAAFYHRNFWDGRANNTFNGVGVFGPRDIAGNPDARLIVLGKSRVPQLGYLELENASLASQAVGPPLSEIEMSCAGRGFVQIARKLLSARPLANQAVDPRDSVLASVRNPFGRGLKWGLSYEELIERAFDEKYWSADGRFRIQDGQLMSHRRGDTQIETNFSMFWGIAIMLYEASLVSDRSEFDTLVAAGNLTARSVAGCTARPGVDPLLLRGCEIFFRPPGAPFNAGTPDQGRGAGCTFCHAGNLFSEAAFEAGQRFPLLLAVGDINNVVDLRDFGFANIGLRPVRTDLMEGAEDPYGNPLSYGRQYKRLLKGDAAAVADSLLQRAVEVGPTALFNRPSLPAWVKLESDGASKIPSMRNVALTPPYFSWGGYPSLRQVLRVYNRGMNRRDVAVDPHARNGGSCTSGDDSGSGPDGDQPLPHTGSDCNTNTSGLIRPLGLLDCDANGVPNPRCLAQNKDATNDDLAALERFLKALTDQRVQCDQAPFDHPSLTIFDGHSERPSLGRRAADVRFTLPAVGAGGYAPQSGLCIPNAGDLFAPGMQSRSGGARVKL
jgi:cytochrome c peroxidase